VLDLIGACAGESKLHMRVPGRDSSGRIRIAFIITGLPVGGAELMLWKLLSRIDRARFDPFLVVLNTNINPTMPERFSAIGIDCHFVRMPMRSLGIAGSWRLARLLRQIAPDLVQGWLYHGNVVATLVARLAGLQVPVLWSIRGTLPAGGKTLSSFVTWLSGRLSTAPCRIINNSVASALEHERVLSYPVASRLILPNGFDTELYAPSTDARIEVRAELRLPLNAILVGLFGRYHPMKDHATFIRAAARVSREHAGIHFLVAGEQTGDGNEPLRALVDTHGLSDRVSLLGLRADMQRLTAALDMAVSSSAYGEGFANVVGEAMSCGVPCVVTDVGDSAWIVGDTGRVVPPGDDEALARAMLELIESGAAARARLGACARQRIVEHFALDDVTRRYEDVYVQVHNERMAGAQR